MRTGFVPLAWRNLVASKPRLVRAGAGIGFAVLLMLVQLGFERAFFASSLAVIGRLDGDLFIINASKDHFATHDPFPRRLLYAARAVPGVATARPLYGDWQDFFWRNPKDGGRYRVQALAFDPDQPVLDLPGLDALGEQLKAADTVAVDSRARRFLGMGPGVATSELNGTAVRIAGRFALGPDFTSDGTVVMSTATFAALLPGNRGAPPAVEVGVVKVAPGHDVAAVRRALVAALPAGVTVMTRKQLAAFEERFQAAVSSAGPIFAMGTLVGFVVGMLISYQVVYTDLSEQLPQYATLKGMGYGTGYLVRVVLTQAALTGLAGYIPAWLVCLLIYRVIGAIALLPLAMTTGLTLLSLGLTLGMCLISAGIALRRVITADPAEIF